MGSKSKVLNQDHFFYTEKRVFRLSCDDPVSIYKGIDFGENFYSVIEELMTKFVDFYQNDKGKSLAQISPDTYETKIYSSIALRDFTVQVNYIDEYGKKKFSSSLYYFAIELIV